MSEDRLTHIDARGEAHMVDVTAKDVTDRRAVAEGFVRMAPATLALALEGDVQKGDVLATARIAGIMAAKRTHEIIPLCHPLPLTQVTVDLAAREDPIGIHVTATAKVTGKTGVEMEALTAASAACLTIYDMLKAVDREMEIVGIRLTEKSGGRSGSYVRKVAGWSTVPERS